MPVTDRIADMLTRIRNASSAHHETVDIPASGLIKGVADVLLKEGYIKNVEVIEQEIQDIVRIELKYVNHKPAIAGIKRISKPGLRIYSSASDMPRVLDGLGIAIVSTSKGLMTDKACREDRIGGEVLAYVW